MVGFDKSRLKKNKLNKGEDMGLDQHAHLRNHKVDWDKYFNDDKEENEKVFVWRKHARLQQFMAKKWAEQNPAVESRRAPCTFGFQWRSRSTMLYD